MIRDLQNLDVVDINNNDKKSFDMIFKQNNIKITDYYANEWLNCRKNPLYFIQNYVYIPETGGMLKYDKNVLHPKLRRVIRITHKYHRCVLMASRQLGKSTVSACLLAWAAIFNPGLQSVILNFKKDAAIENLDRIKFIINNLPDWLRWTCERKDKSDRLSYLVLRNGSKIKVMYPATTQHPTTIARSLTIPCLYIDESAFIRNMREIYGLN
jgi:hypothetical protein